MDADAVREALRTVDDPVLDDDLVSLGLVNDVTVDDDLIAISLALGAPYAPEETAIAASVREAVGEIADGRKLDLSARIDRDASEDEVLPDVTNVIAVASGKGGVGKSTVAVNLAAGLSRLGARVGLLDADVYGPNVPRMIGAQEAPDATEDETLVPPERFGVRHMSMAFLTGEDDPVIWRGPVVHQIVTQLVEDVAWGELDYLVVDLPPGTGDTQLTVLQTLPVTGAVIVTTPQGVATDDARRGLRMFGEHDTPVLGIVENMSTFTCPDCGGEHDLFGTEGGRAVADRYEVPFLGAIPIDPAVRAGGDDGAPIVLDDGGRPATDAFRVVTENVANNVGALRRRDHADGRTAAVTEPAVED